MPRRYLRSLISAFPLAFIVTGAPAEPDRRGLISIWKGHIDSPPSDGFVGTGFHVGGGFVVTAKHVLEDIGDEWFGIVGSFNAVGNRVRVVSGKSCFKEADICFFRLDPSDSSITDKELSAPYGITCEMPTPWPKAYMNGFSGETKGAKQFLGITVQANEGTFQTPDGTIYNKMLQTDAQTSPGTSGSPVAFSGARDAIGVHVAFSNETNDQVVFPFYLLTESIQIDGAILFQPSMCAAGGLKLETPGGPQVVVKSVSLGSAGSCIEFGFSRLPSDFDLGLIKMKITSIDGPNTISPGDNAAIPISQTFNLPLSGDFFFNTLPFSIEFRAPFSSSRPNDFGFIDICPLLPQPGTSADIRFEPSFFAPDGSQIQELAVLDGSSATLAQDVEFTIKFDKQLTPVMDTLRFRILDDH